MISGENGKLTSLPDEVGALLNLTLPEGPLGKSKVPSSEPIRRKWHGKKRKKKKE